MFEKFKISEHACQEQQPEPKVLTERTDGEVLHNPTFYIEINILVLFSSWSQAFLRSEYYIQLKLYVIIRCKNI